MFQSRLSTVHQPTARRIHIVSSDQIVDEPHGVPYGVVHVRMPAARSIRLQQRIRVVGDAVIAVRALSVITRVDRDGTNPRSASDRSSATCSSFFCAGSVQDDDGRAAGDFFDAGASLRLVRLIQDAVMRSPASDAMLKCSAAYSSESRRMLVCAASGTRGDRSDAEIRARLDRFILREADA